MNTAAPPPIVDALAAMGSTVGPEGPFRLKPRAVRGRSAKTHKTGLVEDDGVRRVRAEIEASDESATYLESGFEWLDEKWGALSVYVPAGGEDPEVSDKIVGFDWQALLSSTVHIAVVMPRQRQTARSGQQQQAILAYFRISEQPKMVIAAESDQTDDAELVYDEDEDTDEDEFNSSAAAVASADGGVDADADGDDDDLDESADLSIARPSEPQLTQRRSPRL